MDAASPSGVYPPEALAAVDASQELGLAVRGPHGALRPPVTIWGVTTGGGVYVRTWYRRDSGWFGRVLRTGRARLSVPGTGPNVDVDVRVEDVGSDDDALRAAVDAAYRTKYGRYGAGSVDRMVGDEAAATTLRLVPEG